MKQDLEQDSKPDFERDRDGLPKMMVVGAARREASIPLSWPAFLPRREQFAYVLRVMVGLWPVFAIFAMLIGFAWGFAMFNSP